MASSGVSIVNILEKIRRVIIINKLINVVPSHVL